MQQILKVAKKIGLSKKDLILYGDYKAKIKKLEKADKKAKVVLMTAITPSKYGEGKTTNAISLADSLNYLNVKTILNLREPSLGPVFGLKGGAVGGGKNVIEPSMDINLHFNGDFHAITSTNNLIASCIDNTLYWGNSLNLDPSTITFKRCLDMNDRNLREFPIEINKQKDLRNAGFVITAASELMAIFCLSKDEDDFINKVNNIIIGYTYDKKELHVSDLNISNSIRLLMKDALLSNLVQTGYHNPCIIHGGPFANIACGCNSIISLKQATSLGDVVVTEAGFGADLGAEKFIDIVSRLGGIKPDLACLVVTVRALKLHGGVLDEDLEKENISAIKEGLKNMQRHIDNLHNFGLKVVVCLSKFSFDTKKELEFVSSYLKEHDIPYAINLSYMKGVKGGLDLAKVVISELNKKENDIKYVYDFNEDVKAKIEKICKNIYHASDVEYTSKALEDIENIEHYGHGNLPICMAKTPNSFTDDAKILNAPNNFKIHIKRVNLANGAGLIIPITGSIMLLPGLPKVPNACKIGEK